MSGNIRRAEVQRDNKGGKVDRSLFQVASALGPSIRERRQQRNEQDESCRGENGTKRRRHCDTSERAQPHWILQNGKERTRRGGKSLEKGGCASCNGGSKGDKTVGL